jgi:hypothetical protein
VNGDLNAHSISFTPFPPHLAAPRIIAMVRATSLLLRTLHTPPVSHTPSRSPLIYSLGLSYASKSSPPFVPPNAQPDGTGFAGKPSKVGRWVDEMLSLRAGRGELQGGIEGGWSEETQMATRRWGAGEDFFALVEGGGYVRDAPWSFSPTQRSLLLSLPLCRRFCAASLVGPTRKPGPSI